jgi:hypothetical protein
VTPRLLYPSTKLTDIHSLCFKGGLYRVILTPDGAAVADTPFMFQSDGGLDVEQGPDGKSKPPDLAIFAVNPISAHGLEIYIDC